jgi:hypothetical protein
VLIQRMDMAPLMKGDIGGAGEAMPPLVIAQSEPSAAAFM